MRAPSMLPFSIAFLTCGPREGGGAPAGRQGGEPFHTEACASELRAEPDKERRGTSAEQGGSPMELPGAGEKKGVGASI